ncbi:hypothetical protein KL86CLO1_10341 [uncultured Eubacteriales bacterium]|uniref:Uncharacterized protein n=1 Tax=uncultured Eubacteriales bacterium TaxID=172733 RepID=A0A212J124_9FIRM|nr:hypothetical protein KL86CLO1_10341 [uncultured Eubacteriales bacterium]
MSDANFLAANNLPQYAILKKLA